MEWLKKLVELIPLLESYPTWVKVLVLLWILISSAVVVALIFAPRTRPKLEVTDILVDTDRPDHTAVLDFRVINRSDKTLTISRVRFEVVSVEEHWLLGALQSSAKYDLDISELAKPGDHAEVAVSNVLPPSGADRFLLVLAAKNMDMGTKRIWQLRPVLVTSEGESEAPPVTVVLESLKFPPTPTGLKEPEHSSTEPQ